MDSTFTVPSPKLMSPRSKDLNMNETMSPRSREVALTINSISRHNRTSILRLERAGFAVHSPIAAKDLNSPRFGSKTPVKNVERNDVASPTVSKNYNGITIPPEPVTIGPVDNSVDENVPVSTEPVLPSTPQSLRVVVERTPLQAFVTSLPESTTPLTRSMKKNLESKGELLVYRERFVEIYAPIGK